MFSHGKVPATFQRKGHKFISKCRCLEAFLTSAAPWISCSNLGSNEKSRLPNCGIISRAFMVETQSLGPFQILDKALEIRLSGTIPIRDGVQRQIRSFLLLFSDSAHQDLPLSTLQTFLYLLYLSSLLANEVFLSSLKFHEGITLKPSIIFVFWNKYCTTLQQ